MTSGCISQTNLMIFTSLELAALAHLDACYAYGAYCFFHHLMHILYNFTNIRLKKKKSCW